MPLPWARALADGAGAGSHWNGAGLRPPQQAQQQRLYEENRKFNQKVSQFKGVLRTTIDKLSEQSANPEHSEPVMPANTRHRLSSAGGKQSDHRADLKKEFIEFSRAHGGGHSGGGGSRKGKGHHHKRSQSTHHAKQNNSSSSK